MNNRPISLYVGMDIAKGWLTIEDLLSYLDQAGQRQQQGLPVDQAIVADAHCLLPRLFRLVINAAPSTS